MDFNILLECGCEVAYDKGLPEPDYSIGCALHTNDPEGSSLIAPEWWSWAVAQARAA